MTDWIRELARVVSFAPAQRVVLDWPAIESAIGVETPNSYREYVESFPSGRIDGTLFVIHPAGPGGAADAEDYMFSVGTAFNSLREVTGDVPFEFYPRERGLIPWGAWEARRLLFTWHPIGDPDTWPIVMLNDDLEYQETSMTLSEFLTRLVRRDGDWHIVAEDFWEQDFTFHPGRMP
jgi:hypothetical protein